MAHYKFRGVNEAFTGLVRGIHEGTIYTVKSPSRVGDVLQIPEPVIVTYSNPLERVLFNEARDANPFFHMYEALWMLAGRNDLKPLEYYASKIGEFVDDGDGIANGAYGYRWRHADTWGYVTDDTGTNIKYKDVDQIQLIIEHLRQVPTSRRVVLQMWSVYSDLLKIGTPIETTDEANKQFRTFKPDPNYSKDVCCNLSVLLSIRKEKAEFYDQEDSHFGSKFDSFLDMTVTNRSNDLTLGMLGANIVHFSMLQEYIANCLEVSVGVYNQFSNNLHCYTSRWEPEKWLKEEQQRYQPNWKHVQLVQNQQTFDNEVKQFIELNKNYEELNGGEVWKEPFLHEVAQPMMHAFHMHKQRDYDAAESWMTQVRATDWRIAGQHWIEKRRTMWEAKQEVKE